MKRKYVIAGVLFFAAAAVCLVMMLPKKTPKVVPPPKAEYAEAATEEADYQSPINFAKLWKENPDVCGWLEIPGTDITYPVLQNAEDDTLYLYHNIDKVYDVNGSLFTEHEYNSSDFSDPVTIIYGHHMKSGAMFGNLQRLYTDQFDELREIVMYLPEEELHYQVFAAVPYSNQHILYHYDGFQMVGDLESFAKSVFSVRAIGATVDDTVSVKEGDRLLILSTCLQGDNTCRFLVIGKLLQGSDV